MRASSDFFVVGVTGIGTALFLMQLLIAGARITAANNHAKAELAAEQKAVPFRWMDTSRRISKPILTWINPGCCFPIHRPYPRPDDLSNVPEGHPILAVQPEYPQRALDRGISGYVDLIFTMEPDGAVASPRVVAEVPEGYGFANAAITVFSKWRFQPGSNPSRAASSAMRYRMSFRTRN